MTVMCRRSPAASASAEITGGSAGVCLAGAVEVAKAPKGGSDFTPDLRSVIASSNIRRSPTVDAPNSFKSSAVRRGRTFSLSASRSAT
jgi:hypothetical protein